MEAVDARKGIASFDAVPETTVGAILEAKGAVRDIDAHDAVENFAENEISIVAENSFWTAVEKDAEFLAKNDCKMPMK